MRHITPFGLRMPEDLKSQVQALAKQEDRSMNSLIVRIVKSAIDQESRSASGQQA